MTLAAGARLGPYEILAPLGQGGMGEVWRARDTKLGREVALKVLPQAVAADPERLARFEREAQLLAALNHPHIAAIYGVEDSTATKALVLELVEGETLAERVARGAVPVAETIAIARQVAEALQAAHGKGIVHRDLKPANVKLTADGAIKVLDFGLAKALDPAVATSGAPTSPTLANSPTLTAAGTQLGVILGTAAYMAPEQARGGPVDKRADLWALGCLLYEMLSGRRAFGGDTVSDTLAAILRADVEWSALPPLPPALRRLLDRCLEKDRKRRLHDAGDALLELEEAASSSDVEPAAPRARARIWPWLALLAAAAAAAFGLGRWLTPPAPVERGAVRLVLPAPAGSTFHDVPVVSPDGRKIAFLARQGTNKLTLQVQHLDSSAATVLTEIDGGLDSSGNHPAWSPASDALAFCDGRKLRIAELAGGALRTLADCGFSARGVAWGQSGILYAPASNGPISLVGPEGGEARIVTRFDDQVPDLSHRFPGFLPDGHRFLYLAWSNAAGAAAESLGIFVADLERESAAPRKVSDARSNAVYVGDERGGRLVFQREKSVVGAGFDLHRMSVTGGEVVILPEVQRFANGGYAFFSANVRGDFLSLQPQGYLVSVLNVIDRQGTDIGLINLPAIYRQLKVSRDGRMAAALITDLERGLDDVWVIDLERQLSTRLTRGPDTHEALVWRPDGRAVVYAGESTGLQQPYIQLVDGSAPEELLATTGERDTPGALSADGRWLVLNRRGPERRMEIWARDLRDGREVVLCRFSTGDCDSPALSPDDRAVAFVSSYSGRDEVYVRPFLGEGPQLQLSSGGGAEPHWRTDGGEIVYRDPEGWTVSVEISQRPQLAAKPPKRLFLVGTDSLVAPLPDHSRFLISGRSVGGATVAPVLLGWR